MVTWYLARTKWAILVQGSPCPYKVGIPDLRLGFWLVYKLIVFSPKRE